jgi:hypothetical protein
MLPLRNIRLRSIGCRALINCFDTLTIGAAIMSEVGLPTDLYVRAAPDDDWPDGDLQLGAD